jgi:hypothetical protein
MTDIPFEIGDHIRPKPEYLQRPYPALVGTIRSVDSQADRVYFGLDWYPAAHFEHVPNTPDATFLVGDVVRFKPEPAIPFPEILGRVIAVNHMAHTVVLDDRRSFSMELLDNVCDANDGHFILGDHVQSMIAEALTGQARITGTITAIHAPWITLDNGMQYRASVFTRVPDMDNVARNPFAIGDTVRVKRRPGEWQAHGTGIVQSLDGPDGIILQNGLRYTAAHFERIPETDDADACVVGDLDDLDDEQLRERCRILREHCLTLEVANVAWQQRILDAHRWLKKARRALAD